jgi:hypothetical protein
LIPSLHCKRQACPRGRVTYSNPRPFHARPPLHPLRIWQKRETLPVIPLLTARGRLASRWSPANSPCNKQSHYWHSLAPQCDNREKLHPRHTEWKHLSHRRRRRINQPTGKFQHDPQPVC